MANENKTPKKPAKPSTPPGDRVQKGLKPAKPSDPPGSIVKGGKGSDYKNKTF